ncbi:TetR/AcrR family transcriptional regulator [Actinopolyspora halophila]|uniref:TetR/AcrR family transcriptional regulator n=1 Tax=Actinopolyspora halophila TaxID=1850 RepID=UPI00036C1809|nr:TetR/AcrR family transcriptional regulator [Actinopolyspora halophila]
MIDRTARSAATRRRFVEVALRLFRDEGYAQTSMSQIAQAAGGSRANLYLYFNSKPQLVTTRMRELEPEVEELYTALDELPDHSPETMLGWVDRARQMWFRYAAEFESIYQAMSAESDILEEWLGLIHRMCRAQVVLYRDCASEEERLDRQAHMFTLMMSLERNFYFLYVRQRGDQEDRILAALANQWARLFAE